MCVCMSEEESENTVLESYVKHIINPQAETSFSPFFLEFSMCGCNVAQSMREELMQREFREETHGERVGL